MTREQLAERGRQAEAAYAEFVGPAIDQARAEYMEALTRLAANEPWRSDKIVKLSIAMRVIDKVSEQMKLTMANGIDASKQMQRAQEIAELPAAKRRWLDVLPH
jgi:hypothetical protein